MSLATAAPPISDVDMVVTIDVGPGGLDGYLALVGDRRGPRIQCRQGSLTLVSPSRKHERGERRLDAMVQEICIELDIDYQTVGSSLLRPPGQRDDGIEPDSCYYIANEPAVRALTGELDLSTCPPPDLAIEVVATHSPAKALAICFDLGIPEVWVYWTRRDQIEFLHREPGQYITRDRSRSFPFLAPADVLPWLRPTEEPDNRWRRRLRAWVREELGPRRAIP